MRDTVTEKQKKRGRERIVWWREREGKIWTEERDTHRNSVTIAKNTAKDGQQENSEPKLTTNYG